MESLRLTLLKVEQSAEPEQDAGALAELKRILLQRIAELEAIQAIESAAPQTDEKPNPADLVPRASVTSEESRDFVADVDLSTSPADTE